MHKFTHLDLFSGIGGFSLGLESTDLYETVAFCEIEPFARKVLRKHWPDPTIPIYEDINDYRWLSLPRPLSGREARRTPGKKKRAHIRPDWIVIENEGHRYKRWVPVLRRELHKRGYSSLPIRVRADYLGFPHRRARVFLVAHTDSIKLRKLAGWWQREGRQVATKLAKPEDYAPRGLGTDDGVSDGIHRRRVIGNSIVPQIAAIIGTGIAWIESLS